MVCCNYIAPISYLLTGAKKDRHEHANRTLVEAAIVELDLLSYYVQGEDANHNGQCVIFSLLGLYIYKYFNHTLLLFEHQYFMLTCF